MKNNLLLTTALVAASFVATNAWADPSSPEEWDGNSFSGQSSTTAVKKVSEKPVTANNAKVENNSNTSGGVGGAVYVQVPDGKTPAGNLTLNGGVFSNNYSKYDGGAIGNYGNLIVNGTKFRNNRAQFENVTGEKKASTSDSKPIGGGAISLGAQSHTYIQDAEFTNNESGTDGGAISTRHQKDGDLKDARLTVENSTFTGNTALVTEKKGYGGAIFNSFAHDYDGNDGVLLKNNTFETNVAYRGGAIFGEEGSNTIVDGGEFKENEASQGGAIWTQRKGTNTPGAKLTVQNGTTFENNKVIYGGGAIWSGGKTDIFGATFKENQVTGTNGDATTDMEDNNSEGGGAIFVGSASTVTIEDSIFDTNFSGTVGGAIATRGNSDGKESGLTVNHSQFLHNKANTSGGAINIGSSKEGTVDDEHRVTITNSEFDDNSSANGGAIYSKGTVTIENSLFTNNKADKIGNKGGVGGAILNSGSDAKMTITNTIFDGNTALQGGAIYGNGGTVSIKGGRFTNNEATGSYGGAIASSDDTTLSLEDVTFEDNHAKEDGGAISLTKEATFKGNNVFKNNSVGENKKNDLAIGSGKVTLAAGASLSLDGGISGKDGTLTLEKGSTLTVKDKTKVESKVQSAGNGENAYASVHVVVTEKTMNDEDHELKLVGEDGIFTQTGSEVFSSFNKNNNMPSSYITSVEDMFDKEANNLYTFEKTKESSSSNVTYTVKERSAGDVANRLGVKEAEAATLLATSSSKTGSGNEAFDDIQDTLRSAAQYGNDSDSLSRAADALVADAAPVVQTRETMLSNMIFDAASDALDDNASALVVGQASGDSLVEKAKIWIKGLFNSADKDETSKAHGFDIDTYGVAMGADKEIGAGKVGLGYAYSQSDINGYTRDTDVDTHSLFVYGQYQPADWYVKGVAAYSWSDYEEKKSVLGKNADAKYDVNTWALEGLYGYDFHLDSGYDITPEGGLRYLHASQDSYTNGLGVRVKDRDIDVLTAVAGVKVAKDFAFSNGLNIRPEVRAAVTYDLSTDDNESSVVLTNGQAIKVDGEELDRFGVEFGAKVATDVTSQWEVAAGYEGRFRDEYSDHTGMLSAKYKF